MPNSIYEPSRVMSWLETTLTPLAAGGAWEGLAPDSVTQPYIVYQMQGAPLDITGPGGVRLWTETVWTVKVMGPSEDGATLAAIADSVDNALQRKGEILIGPALDVLLIRMLREGVIPIPAEIVNGDLWSTLATSWRSLAKSAAA